MVCDLQDQSPMDPLTTAAASGLQARMDSMDMLANNLANTSTAGFKADREFYSSYLAPEVAQTGGTGVGEEPTVQQQWTDFSQGTMVDTGSKTDLALSGTGFFAVNGPSGPLYTRNGSFRISPQGVLVTAEGYPVRLTGGQTLQTQPNSTLEFQPDGEVSQDGAVLGQLELVDFQQPNQLSKTSGAYFQVGDPQNNPATASSAQVIPGKLETSNAGPAEAAARMVTLLRHFEMLQHAVKIGTEMNREAVEEVARVGS